MPRLAARDLDAVGELARGLATLEEGGRPALAWLLPELRRLLGAERVLAYRVARRGQRFELDFGHWSGFPLPAQRINELMREALGEARGRPWALYDPGAADPYQRNLVVEVPASRALRGRHASALFRKLRVGSDEQPRLVSRMQALDARFLSRVAMNDMHVCRALVCDGADVLAWIGACQSEPFDARARALLQRLVGPLARRLRVERTLATAPLCEAALPALLDAVPREALVCDERGHIRWANAAARALVAARGDELAEALRAALAAPEAGEFDVLALEATGVARHYLVLRRATASPAARLAAATRRWSLSPAEARVLERLVWGESTKRIAAELGCVARTVEVHVTRILARAGVDSRGALIARFWTS